MNLFNLSNSIKELQSIIKKTLDIKKADNINCKDFELNIFNKGVNDKLDTAELEHLDIKQQLECMRLFLDSQIIEKIINNREKVHIHQTDKSGIFLITTKTRAKKLKTLSEFETQTLQYIVDGENKELLFDIKSDFIKEGSASGNTRLDSALLNKIYHRTLRQSLTKRNINALLKLL